MAPKYQREIWADLSIAPLFCYRKKDYAFYAGASLDFMIVSSQVRNSPNEEPFFSLFWDETGVLPTVSSRIGYWQRLGNMQSPWFLDLSFSRRHISGIPYLFVADFERGIVWWNFTVALRYQFP